MQDEFKELFVKVSVIGKDNFYFPDNYSVLIYNVNKEDETRIQAVPIDYVMLDEFIGQNIKVKVNQGLFLKWMFSQPLDQ